MKQSKQNNKELLKIANRIIVKQNDYINELKSKDDICANCGIQRSKHHNTPDNSCFSFREKSHSRLNAKNKKNVRAQEDGVKGNSIPSVPSSVPFNPLTKSKFDDMLGFELTDKESVLSALNGLRQDDNREVKDIFDILSQIELLPVIRNRIKHKLNKISKSKNKWFPIGVDEK